MSILTTRRFTAVGLDELIAEASLLTRIDRKYLLAETEASALLTALDPRTRVLTIEGRTRFRYASTYFDTDALISYHQAAYGRRRRFKVRTRDYLDAGTAFLEVKVRGNRDITVKDRIEHDPAAGAHLTPDERRFVRDTLDACRLNGSLTDDLHPALSTRYTRITLLPPEDDTRITLDTGLTWDDGIGELTLPGVVIIETKSGLRPSAIDRLLWQAGHRPQSLSKYATGTAALRRDMPANKWARVIRRHFPADELAHAA
ncbi:MAG: polyphosphate polymerase domain-containing protein [Nigerium sp.]|nr:polyphosphate polymerase domain-containing protein [Nigerium sp.]